MSCAADIAHHTVSVRVRVGLEHWGSLRLGFSGSRLHKSILGVVTRPSGVLNHDPLAILPDEDERVHEDG